MNLMGRRIPFVICGIDEDKGWLTCSRKRAQELLKTSMLQGLQSGRIYEGEIVGFSRYGGYVEVGGVTGHIRNSDFTTDHSDIREYMKMGDRLEVRCKEISASDGYIFWEAVNKQHRTEPLAFDFEPDTIVWAMSSGSPILARALVYSLTCSWVSMPCALCPATWRSKRTPASPSRSRVSPRQAAH